MLRWSLPLLGLVAIAGAAVACDGLSPGDQLRTEDGLCTLAFVVAAPDGLYFATAGHCIQVDQAASTPDHPDFGVGVFHFLEPENGAVNDGEPGKDFGLIRVHPEFWPELNPKVCGWDGPTGIYEETPGSGGVQHWGHGTVFGDLGPTGQRREGQLMANDGEAFYWLGAGVPGDSGSAVLSDDGRALGVLTHLNIGVGPAGTPMTNGGTHILHGFKLAAEEGFTQLRLVLAGEDPIAVLAQMQAASPPTAQTPPEPGETPPTTPTTSGQPTRPPEPGRSPSPTPATPTPTNDNIAPAAVRDDDGDGKKGVPAPFALLLLAGAVLALARRKR